MWWLYHRGSLIEAWEYPALEWAVKGHFSPCPAFPDPCFVLASLNDSFPNTSVGLGMGVIGFSVSVFPTPFLLLEVVFGSKMPCPVCDCSSSCGCVWSGRERSSTQMVLCAPSICFAIRVTNCLPAWDPGERSLSRGSWLKVNWLSVFVGMTVL